MDALKLRLRAKDQLHPILQELVTGYARFKGSKDWEGRSKMVSWCAPCTPVFDISGSHYQAYYLEQHEGIRRNHRRTVPAGKFTAPGDGRALRADIFIAFI
jgi:hypothetical protein